MAGRQRGIVIEIDAQENTARAFAAVDAQVSQLRNQVQSLKAQLSGTGEALAQGMGHAVPEIAAASGAIREFEGTLPIRAVERFLTTTLGLGPLLAQAFPLVGAIAFIGVIGDAIAKLEELYKTASNAPEALRRATEEVTLRLKLQNDELDLSNVKLAEEVAKLEGKPANGVAAALDESRNMAERLAIALDDDLKKLDALLADKDHEITFSSGLLTGQASTAGIQGDVKARNRELDELANSSVRKLSDALAASGGDDKKAAAAKKAFYDQLDKDFGDYINRYQSKIDALRKGQQEESGLESELLVRAVDATAGGKRQAGEIQSAQTAIEYARQLRDSTRMTATKDTITTKKNTLTKTSGGSRDNSIADARKALDDALRKQAEEFAQVELSFAKQQEDLQLAQLDDKHKRMLVSDLDYYEQRKKIQETALDAEDTALRAKEGALADQLRKVIIDRGRPGIGEADQLKDTAKVVELQTQITQLEDQRKKLTEERAKIDIDAAAQVYQLSLKQMQQTNELAAKHEAITGGVEARLHQSADSYDLRRKQIVSDYGEGSPQEADARAVFGNEQSHIRATGAEETEGAKASDINARRTAIDDSVARGTTTSLDAQRQKIALDQEEARALQPVLAAYQELAASGDLQATEKVAELKTRIAELKDPVDEVAQHMRESFDGAFESLFENMDQGLKDFESFTRSIEKTLEQAVYKKAIEPVLQNALGKLIPNSKGGPGYGDPGISGVHAIPANPGTDIGGGAVKAAASIGSALGIPGLSGGGKKDGSGSITITLVNEGGLPLKIGDLKTSGNIDKNQVISILKDDFEEGGFLRSLFTGFHV